MKECVYIEVEPVVNLCYRLIEGIDYNASYEYY